MPTPLKKNSDRAYYLFALRIAGDFGVAIAAPIVILTLIGQKIDAYTQRGPLFTILAFVLAALISGLMIYRKAKKYGEEFQKLNSTK